MAMCWCNGHYLADDLPLADANNRGLLLGEGVFETMRCLDGSPEDWDLHWARLRRATDFFAIVAPYSSEDMREAACALLVLNQHAQGAAVLRLTVNTGSGGRGLISESAATPMWLLQSGAASTAAPSPLSSAIKLHVSSIVRLSNAPTSRHKTTNYLNEICARKQALAADADEALLLNEHGRVVCAAAGNVFVQHGGRLLTPPVGEGALAGIMRHKILALKTVAGLPIMEFVIERADLDDCEAVLVCNCVQGVRGVAAIDGKPLSLSPSALPQQLAAALSVVNGGVAKCNSV